MTPTEIKVTKARTNLLMEHPFFGSLALRMDLREAKPEEKVETATVDGETIKYNPEFIDGLSLEETQGLFAACVMHVGLLHHTRRGNRDIKRWQKATDHAVNSILDNTNLTVPSHSHCPAEYKDKTAESIYRLLEEEETSQDSDNGADSGDGGDNDDENGRSPSDPNGDGAVGDSQHSTSQGASESQQKAEEDRQKQNMVSALTEAKQQGNVPGGMERFVDELLTPQVNWKEELRRFMTEKSNDDFTWQRPNRRHIAEGLYLPTRYSEGGGDVVMGIDTSCSIGQQELDEFASEIKAVHEEVKPNNLWVIYCDATIQHVDCFGPNDELTFELHGGGGTSFNPVFEWVEEHQLNPKFLVYLTDGYCDWPEEPDYPVLWCINNDDIIPEWGEHLSIESNGEQY